MVGMSVAVLIRRWSTGRSLLAFAAAILIIFGLAAFSASIVEAPGRTAPWAPALGVLAAAALIATPRYRIPVIVLGSLAVFAANIVAGQALAFAGVLAVIRMVEIVVFCQLVDRAGRLPRLDSVVLVLRFVVAAVVAASIFAAGVLLARVVAGLPVQAVLPIDSLVAHIVALLLVTPLALARRDHGRRASSVETVLQTMLLLGTIAAVFSPLNSLPLAFLPLPLFAWAALRLPAVTIALQLLAVALLSSAATLVGWGPFGAGSLDGIDARESIILLQVFLLVFAASTLVLWAKRVEGDAAAERARVKDAILRRSIEQAQTGLLLVERLMEDVFIVVQANSRGLETLGLDPQDDFFSGSSEINVALPPHHPLLAGLNAMSPTVPAWRGELELSLAGGPMSMDVVIEQGSGEAVDVLAVELTDVTAAREEGRRLRGIVERERSLSAQYQQLAGQKDDFLASVSHELRTPLSSIVGYLETLEETALDDAQRRFVETIRRNADRLQERVEELLTAARRSGAEGDDLHPVDVARLTAEVVDDLRPLAAARSISIASSTGQDVPWVRATEDAVTRSVTNVLANAVKFAPTGSTIDVDLVATGDRLQIVVADTGPGIPAEDREKVFDRFYRTEDARMNAVPGTGLGLGIVRALLTGVGAIISIEANQPRGTRVVMTFLVDADRPSGAEAAPVRSA